MLAAQHTVFLDRSCFMRMGNETDELSSVRNTKRVQDSKPLLIDTSEFQKADGAEGLPRTLELFQLLSSRFKCQD